MKDLAEHLIDLCTGRRRPRVLLLADRPGWAFDHCAQAMRRHLGAQFRFDVRYAELRPRLRAADYDLLYVFFWGETYHQAFGFGPEQVVKEVSSHRWEDDARWGPCTPAEMVRRHLRDAGSVICTSPRLAERIRPFHPRVVLSENGYDADCFSRTSARTGSLVIGWAGNAKDGVKGVTDILQPACAGAFELRLADGTWPRRRMNGFFNELDVYAIASAHEGTPLPLLESMAAGCFPVTTDVGIVPEIIRHQENGYLVPERTPAAFRAAFAWCAANLAHVREAGARNAAAARDGWRWGDRLVARGSCLDEIAAHAQRPLFRNDDVSPDISLERFREFCAVFHRHGLTQLHGVTLRGRTVTVGWREGREVQYEGELDISRLPNARIRELSESLRLESRPDLIAYLREIPDALALHGLYHTDYSAMSEEEQAADLARGLELMAELFPRKPVRYFIAPFNRTNAGTYRAAAKLGLTVLAADGIHLENTLAQLEVRPGTWHRYHHHRFYPESRFNYDLSLEQLDAALTRALGPRPAA